MALNTFKCNSRTPLHFKWLNIGDETVMRWCAVYCRNNDLSSLPDLYSFSVDHVAYGQHRTHDLKPGGRHIAVTEHNKLEYTQ